MSLQSQFVLTSINKHKTAMSVASNILFQMSAKLGNTLWRTEMPTKAAIMHVGIEFYHKLTVKKDSCVGLVANVNPQVTKYYSRGTVIPQGKNLAEGIQEFMVNAL
jgi:hypothetical protein